MLSDILNIFYLGVTTGCVFLCMLITWMMFTGDGRVDVYEKHRSILRFEVALLTIGFFITLWFGAKLILAGGL